MKKQEKNIGFFKKVFLAITDFRIYPHILRTENLAKSLKYFIKFMLLITLIIAANIFNNINQEVAKFIEDYNQIVPEFTLVNGVLNVPEKMTIDVNRSTAVIIDTSYNRGEYKSIPNDVNKRIKIYITSDAITCVSPEQEIYMYFSDIEGTHDKASVYAYITDLYSKPLYNVSLLISIYMLVIVAYVMYKFLDVLIVALVVSIACVMYGIRLNYKNYYQIALYTMTLPCIVEVISIVVVGGIRDYTVFTSTILTYLYAFYAVRAIKLDAFLIIANTARNVKIVRENKNLDENEEKSEEGENKEESSTNEEEKNTDTNKNDTDK